MQTTTRRFSTIVRPNQTLSGHTFYVHAIDRDAIRPSPAGVKGRQRYGLETATDH